VNLIEITIIKIGKLAAPALAVLGGTLLILYGMSTIGLGVIVLGLFSYTLIWWWSGQAAINLAREASKKERARSIAEKNRKDRLIAQTQDRAHVEHFEKERQIRKWGDRLAKVAWDSL
jgi:hypothetical protein